MKLREILLGPVMTTVNPIDQLLARLNRVGISTPVARKSLPSWWDDEIALIPSGLQQAQMYMARAFNISLASLADPKAAVIFLASDKQMPSAD